MIDYINGCYTKHGTRPMNILEIKHKAQLSNGMWCVTGFIPEDGLSIDVYKDKELKELVFMEHGCFSSENDGTQYEAIVHFAEVRCQEMGL